MRADLELVSQLAAEAGRLALDLRANGLTVSRKADGSPVTNADLEVDGFLRSRLQAARPDYGWLSEESADDETRLDAARIFVVDPIDGTSAYLRGQPWFVVSIAVVEAGRPLAAAIHAPAQDELYTAVQDGGAYRNGAPLHAGVASELQDCRMLGDAALFRRPGWPEPWPATMQVEARNAIAYRMALVAAGDFDAAVSLGPKFDWDIAGGDLIAREAGGKVSDTRGRALVFNTPAARNDGMICATGSLHPLILAKTAPIDRSVRA